MPGRIPFLAIAAYAAAKGYDAERLDFLCDCLDAMDDEWLTWHRNLPPK